jgi:thiamine biosynthesis protein ThiS
MQLIINGVPTEVAQDVTLESFLAEQGIPLKGVAVERNLEIVPKSAYASTLLGDGDTLEIIQFVGGG